VQSPFEFVYEGVTESAITAGVSLSTLTLPAGTESLIEITAPQLGATAEGALQAGFNSGDIQVRRLWTTANGRILANVWVSPSAAGTTVSLTVSNGLRLLNQTNALQITASPARLIQASLPPGVSGLVPGTAGQLLVQSPQLAGSPTVSLNGQAATVISYDGGILTFAVPANLPAGPIAVRVGMAGEVGLPLGVQVLPPPALITSVIAGINQIISEARPARPGEILTVTVSGLPESISAFGSSPRLTLSVGGIEHRTISVNALGTAVQFQFILQNSVPTGNLPLNVTIDGVSATLPALPVRGLN
jgi:uncharacterized protein (TIGR03437 family)